MPTAFLFARDEETKRKGEEIPMLAEKTEKNIKFVRIVAVLKSLRNSGGISQKEYNRAKTYYKKMTGADIIIAD